MLPRIWMLRSIALTPLVLLPGCDISKNLDPGGCLNVLPGPSAPNSGSGCYSAPASACNLSGQNWKVDAGPDSKLIVNDIQLVRVIAPGCDQPAGSVSVAWSTEAPGVASFVQSGPDVFSAWLAGVAPGRTLVRARLSFGNGVTGDAPPAAVDVLPLEVPAGSTVIAAGTVSVQGSILVPIAVPTSGRLDVLADWGSLSNSVIFWVFPGSCSSVPSCRLPVLLESTTGNHKPTRAFAENVPAGDHTLRLMVNHDNTLETVRYEVRFTRN